VYAVSSARDAWHAGSPRVVCILSLQCGAAFDDFLQGDVVGFLSIVRAAQINYRPATHQISLNSRESFFYNCSFSFCAANVVHDASCHLVPRLRQERGQAPALRPVPERVVLQPRVPSRR